VFNSQTKAVLHVGNFLSASGYTRQFIEELADRLELSGWFVTRTSKRVFRPARLLDMALNCWLHRSSYGVAHIAVFSGKAFIWAEVAARIIKAAGKPYVLSLHGGNLPSFSRSWPARVKYLLSSASVVIVPSGYLFEHMRKYRPDLLLVPNPIDVNNYEFRLRGEVEPKLMWVRAFHQIYNPSLAPRVVANLISDFPDIHLTMVGPEKDGSLKKTLKTAADLGVANQLELPGGVAKADIPRWLDKGDIFINTTNIDNTPISVLEAMSSGLCIVSTDVGGLRYLLTHNYNALLVPPDNPVAMAEAVRRILTDPDLAARLSRNARKSVARSDWSLVLPQWESLMTAAASEGADQRILGRRD
jgi:glycosyltransferase involved in cell wall biosynthesis